MVLSEKLLDDLLNYLDISITKLANETKDNSQFQLENKNLEHFLSSQYDVRLDNLLQKSNSNVHHLESGMKNKTIQRKQALLDSIIKEFKI